MVTKDTRIRALTRIERVDSIKSIMGLRPQLPKERTGKGSGQVEACNWNDRDERGHITRGSSLAGETGVAIQGVKFSDSFIAQESKNCTLTQQVARSRELVLPVIYPHVCSHSLYSLLQVKPQATLYC